MRFTILDRYMLSELAGPFVFGLAAFMLIFAATEILNIGKLVSSEHAPLWAALLVFVWSLPADVVLVIPMALLLGTLLAMQRLSGESEITALECGVAWCEEQLAAGPRFEYRLDGFDLWPVSAG